MISLLAVLGLLSGAATIRGPAAPPPRLITTESLAALLATDSVTVIDVRQSWTSYLQNHLPNAAWLNIETLRSTNAGLPFQLYPAESYAQILSRVGVRPARPVVVYSAGDQFDIDATFATWLIAGFAEVPVYLLDGGYAKWELEARPLTQHYPRSDAKPRRLDTRSFRLSTASLEEVKAAAGNPAILLVDARPPEQYHGSAGAQLRRGHIPGAINHPWRDNLEKHDLTLVWKPLDALRESYTSLGVTPDKDVIVYCNSSTEASHVFFALRFLLGYPKVRIYSGAWSEWAEREELPVEQ